MPARKISREAWAEILRDLITKETAGNKSQFVRLINVSYKTLDRWIKGEVEVSELSIRQVADALHISPLPLLVKVGFYAPDEVSPAPLVDQDDPALQMILEADVPPRVKARMIQRLQEIREQERERQVDEVRWWINQAEGA